MKISPQAAKAERFRKAVTRWLQNRPGRVERLRNYLWAFWYIKLSRFELRFRPLAAGSVSSLVPASGPMLLYTFGQGGSTPSFITATTWSLTIMCLFFIAKLGEKALSTGHKRSVTTEELWVQTGELLQRSRNGARNATEKEEAKRICLTLIEIYVRSITGAKEGEIGVALIRYQGASTIRLKADARHIGSKRHMRQFDGTFVLGHHACLAGSDPRAVNDIRAFGPLAAKSPTGSDSIYRSFFIAPIYMNANGELRPMGYVSIDSTRPYEFYGNRANVLAVDCASIIDHLRTLM